MDTVIFQTENAEFDFNREDVIKHLNSLASEDNGDEATKLLELISTSSDETISIPKEHYYFGLVALDLISAGKGFIACKICNKLYSPDQMNPITIKQRINPFTANTKKKWGVIKRLLISRLKLPKILRVNGYKCPEGHELIIV